MTVRRQRVLMQEPLSDDLRITEKRCPACGEVKALTEYYRTRRSVDGFKWTCKPCCNAVREAYHIRLQSRDRVTVESKVCARCKEQKAAAEFSAKRNHVDGLHHTCRRCAQSLKRLWRYGLTPDSFDALMTAQAGLCAICRVKLTMSCHVDHDHDSGAVRGLLCSGCNTGLGSFRDNPAALIAAVDYLEAARKREASK